MRTPRDTHGYVAVRKFEGTFFCGRNTEGCMSKLSQQNLRDTADSGDDNIGSPYCESIISKTDTLITRTLQRRIYNFEKLFGISPGGQ